MSSTLISRIHYQSDIAKIFFNFYTCDRNESEQAAAKKIDN